MTTFALLVFGHMLADYPLQGDFVARGKNASIPIPGVPWLTILLSHAVIHAGFVLVITGSLWLAIAELTAHALIDHAKCTGRFGVNAPLVDPASSRRAFNIDQGLHIACKALWCALLSGGMS